MMSGRSSRGMRGGRGGRAAYGGARGAYGSARETYGGAREMYGAGRSDTAGMRSLLEAQASHMRSARMSTASAPAYDYNYDNYDYSDDYYVDPYSYSDDYGYAAKRPIDELDPMGVKRQRTSSMQMMNMMIQDSQRELANLSFDSPRPRRGGRDPDQLNQVLNRQQMLLEMQSEMIAGMGKRRSKPELTDPYHIAPRGRGRPAASDAYSRRSREEDLHRGRRGAMSAGMPMSRSSYYDYGYEPEIPSMYDHNPYLDYEYEDPALQMSAGPAAEYFVSIEGKLNNFISVLLGYEDLYSPIQAIETSRHDHTSTVKIRTEYNVFEDMDKELCVDGHLKMNGVLLVRDQGKTKHHVKESVYSKALYMLLTKSVSEIFANSNKLYKELPDSHRKVKAENQKDGKGGKPRDHKFILIRLKELVGMLREGLPQGHTDNFVRELDMACGTADAGVTLVYRRANEESVVCELYVDDLMLGSGEESDKRGAMKNAYRNAKRMLMNWNKPVDKVVREGKRLLNVNIMESDLIDLHYKGKNHERGSNLNLLKSSMTTEQFATEVTSKAPPINSWMVTYEHANGGVNMSYKVLEDTASANRVLLEYVIHGGKNGGRNRCLIFMCGQLIADGRGYNKIKAKANAAEKGVQYLRQHCALIKTTPRDYKNPALNFEQAKEKALLLKADSPELARDWDLSSYPTAGPNDPQPDDMTPWVDQVLENLLIDYSKTDDLEEILLEKDFPKYHALRLRDISKKYGVHVIIKRGEDKQNKSNCVVIQRDVFKSAHPTAIVKLLKENDNTSGRLKLVQYVDDDGQVIKC